MIIFRVNSEGDCPDWLGRPQGRNLGCFSVLIVLLGLLSRPWRSCLFTSPTSRPPKLQNASVQRSQSCS